MSLSASATPTPVTTTISGAGGSGTGRDVGGSRVFYSGSPELTHLYDLITLLFTHSVVYRIPPPEVKTPNDWSRMRREESADSKRVFCCSRKTGSFQFDFHIK